MFELPSILSIVKSSVGILFNDKFDPNFNNINNPHHRFRKVVSFPALVWEQLSMLESVLPLLQSLA